VFFELQKYFYKISRKLTVFSLLCRSEDRLTSC